MEKSALEQYFDQHIANDSVKLEIDDVKEEPSEELFFKLLPDELLMVYKDDTNSSTSLDRSSQNSTAKDKLQGGSSVSQPSVSSVHPITPSKSETQKPVPIPQLQNVLSTVKLGCFLDLDLIARTAWNVEYNPKAYKAAIMRIRKPQATVTIYKSGNIVCTGAKSGENSRLAARKCARILQKLGFPVSFLNFKVQNLVASCPTFPLRLERLARYQHCSYEPELFPGLIYKGIPGIAVIVFSTGTISLIGAKKEAEIHEAFHKLYPLLCLGRR